MKALSLFSGIGGIDLACEWAGIETVAFCEREPFCQKVLKKHWPNVPIYDDVCTLTKERLEADGNGTIDLIHEGYPCQPFSHAGKRKGADDDRHLWPEVFRLIQEIGPRWFVGENVAGHITLGLDIVLPDLESIGYTAEVVVLPACSVNAPHRRDRVLVMAYSSGIGWDDRGDHRKERYFSKDLDRNAKESESEWDRWVSGISEVGETSSYTTSPGLQERRQSRFPKGYTEEGTRVEPEFKRCGQDVADSASIRQQRQRELIESFDTTQDRIRQASESLNVRIREHWATEPDVGRVANGVPGRVDRLKALGNAVVPQQIYPILVAIKQIDSLIL